MWFVVMDQNHVSQRFERGVSSRSRIISGEQLQELSPPLEELGRQYVSEPAPEEIVDEEVGGRVQDDQQVGQRGPVEDRRRTLPVRLVR